MADPSSGSLRPNLPRLLLEARESVMASNRPGLRANGLTDPQWRVLRVLAESGTVETGYVAREACISGPSLTGILARMERADLVRRERDTTDLRRTLVAPTRTGISLAIQLWTVIEANYQRVEASMGERRLSRLYELLDELVDIHAVGRTSSR